MNEQTPTTSGAAGSTNPAVPDPSVPAANPGDTVAPTPGVVSPTPSPSSVELPKPPAAAAPSTAPLVIGATPSSAHTDVPKPTDTPAPAAPVPSPAPTPAAPTPQPTPTPTIEPPQPPSPPDPAPEPVPEPTPAPLPLAPQEMPSTNPPEPTPPEAPQAKHVLPAAMIAGIASMVCLIVGLAGGYMLGKSQAKTSTTKAPTTTQEATLKVPTDATVIAQCAVGRGTQYILPKDIPYGPVYNVWKNKVIGIEYMFAKDELVEQSKNYLNMPLHGVKYDHINVGLLSNGHAGFVSPHYHVDVFTVPHAEASAITCK